jgi:hypothetical protein
MKWMLVLLVVLFLAGCSASVKEIKDNPDDYIGKTVSLTGTASASIKIGQLSGFTLTQKDGSKISISSETLPKDGNNVYVKGVVMKDSLFGTYILAKEVR